LGGDAEDELGDVLPPGTAVRSFNGGLDGAPNPLDRELLEVDDGSSDNATRLLVNLVPGSRPMTDGAPPMLLLEPVDDVGGEVTDEEGRIEARFLPGIIIKGLPGGFGAAFVGLGSVVFACGARLFRAGAARAPVRLSGAGSGRSSHSSLPLEVSLAVRYRVSSSSANRIPLLAPAGAKAFGAGELREAFEAVLKRAPRRFGDMRTGEATLLLGTLLDSRRLPDGVSRTFSLVGAEAEVDRTKGDWGNARAVEMLYPRPEASGEGSVSM
jgi:hypothetical protein